MPAIDRSLVLCSYLLLLHVGVDTCMPTIREIYQSPACIYKADEKLGVMVAAGLSCPLCWAGEVYEGGVSVRIESAPLPADA